MIRIAAFVQFLFFLCGLVFPSFIKAEEYRFDPAEIEKKSLHLGGYGEFMPVLLGLDRNARLYNLRFFNQDQGATLEHYDFTLQLDGSYEKGITRLFARTNSNLSYTDADWSEKTDLFEGFLSLKPSSAFTLDLGKKTLKWGKGYAWNPAAFLDRPKNPDDPALNLEGFYVAGLDYIKSFKGPLKTFSFSPVLVPAYDAVNDDFGEAGHLNFGAKFYFLFMDTDIDVMFLAGGSRSNRYGLDFSRNITSNLEIHGEMAWFDDFSKTIIDDTGRIFETRSDLAGALLGIRYLSARDTTYILEYYYNGTGYTQQEMVDYFSFIDKGMDTFSTTGNPALLRQAARAAEGRYGSANPMQNYLYLRISQKEPFDILYFTPALTLIGNLDDHSYSLSPELFYNGITNLELRLKGVWLEGGSLTEYGEKPNDARLEFRIRYYF